MSGSSIDAMIVYVTTMNHRDDFHFSGTCGMTNTGMTEATPWGIRRTATMIGGSPLTVDHRSTRGSCVD